MQLLQSLARVKIPTICPGNSRRCSICIRLQAIKLLFAPFPRRGKMDAAYWPNFHRTKTSVALSVVVVVVLGSCQCVVTVDDVRRLLSADGHDECALQTNSTYTGRCHCSSLLDIDCAGLDHIPRFVKNDRIFAAINMADQSITKVPSSAVDGLKVRVTYYYTIQGAIYSL